MLEGVIRIFIESRYLILSRRLIMSKIPKTPDEILQEVTNDFKKAFGDDLLAIIL